MINILFSMVGPDFDEELESNFRTVAQWVVINRREHRLLIDAIGEPASVNAAFAALDYLGRDPRIIAMWNEDGTLVDGVAFDESAWLAVAPDDLTVDGAGDVVASRPVAWRDLHGWAGWPAKATPAP